MGRIQSLAVVSMLTAILFSGVAWGAAAYGVKLKVPRYVNVGQTFKVKASGVSSTRSRLVVFVSRKRCASSAAAEGGRAAGALISKSVLRGYTASRSVHAKMGTYDVCAYLTPTGHGAATRAHASATYYVLAGGY
jgi:hypothetical protein